MTDDLVKLLREAAMSWRTPDRIVCDRAADRIEKLEEENGVLFAANVRLNSRVDLDCDHYRDRIEKLEAALRALKALHHEGGIDDLQERDDRTYFMVCDALESLK